MKLLGLKICKICKSHRNASLSTLLFNFSVYSLLYFLYDDVTLAVFCINKRDAPAPPDAVFVFIKITKAFVKVTAIQASSFINDLRFL